MKLVKRLFEAIEDVMMTEAAFHRRTTINKIRDLSVTSSKHLILIYLLKDNQALNHWKSELDNYATQIEDLLSNKSGILSYKTLVELLWEEPLGEPRDRNLRLKQLRKKYTSEATLLNQASLETEDFKNYVFSWIKSIYE